MKQPWGSVDRWGPLAVSLLTFLAFIGYAWAHGERTAALEGRADGLQRQIEQRTAIEVALRAEVMDLKGYVLVLHTAMIKGGVKNAPPLPKEAETTKETKP